MIRRAAVLFLTLMAGSAFGQNSSDVAMVAKIRDHARTYLRELTRLTCIEDTRQTISVPGVTSSETRQDRCDTRQYKLFAVQAVKLAGAPAGYNRSRRPGASASDFSERLTDASLEANSAFFAAIVDPKSHADFRRVRADTLSGRQVLVFSFDVPASEGYVLVDGNRTVRAPYKGLIYADHVTGALVRASIKCVDIPRGSEYTGAELTLDFASFDVGGRSIDLPSHTVVRFQMDRGSAINEATYSSYHIADFSTDSAIRFDAEPVDEKR